MSESKDLEAESGSYLKSLERDQLTRDKRREARRKARLGTGVVFLIFLLCRDLYLDFKIKLT